MKKFEITEKKILNSNTTLMKIYAPKIANKAKAGQFIMLRVDEKGERIPLTISDFDREAGLITIIFQIVGKTTSKLNLLEVGDCLADFVGPLGKATPLDGVKKVAVIGGGLGCAIAHPQAKALHELGAEVHTIAGFRNTDFIILEEEMSAVSDKLVITTDDGSNGKKGFVSDALRELILEGNDYDLVIAIGPLIMMKVVCDVTREFNVKTTISMNSIMIDGTGMCGCCRLTVDGQTKFACVDGPDFNGHEVDFDEAMSRGRMYFPFERHAHEEACNLFKEAK